MPTLAQLLKLVQQSPNMLLNIELKGPRSEEFKPRYDFDLACKIVAEHIDRFGVSNRTMVSSFEPLITNKIKLTPNRQFKVVQLMNRGLKDEVNYTTPEGMQGINLSLTHLKQEVIKPVQAKGHTVGIWYSTSVYPVENEETYKLVFGQSGNVVDLFYSDKPLEAMKSRDLI